MIVMFVNCVEVVGKNGIIKWSKLYVVVLIKIFVRLIEFVVGVCVCVFGN